MKASYHIYHNKFLMDYILEYDNTYKEYFSKNIIKNISLKEYACDFWYDKYYNIIKNYHYDYNYLISIQDQFLEIYFTLNNMDFTPNPRRYDVAPNSNYI